MLSVISARHQRQTGDEMQERGKNQVYRYSAAEMVNVSQTETKEMQNMNDK